MLIGRESERSLIDRLLAEARGGKSAALVIRGEAGIGKSALLEYAAARAGAATVVRALGVETESEFAYSGLHELVRPLLHRLDQLPGVQADALRGALALAPAQGAGRLYIGAATLSLLAAGAGDGQLLCVVDDAQWLDEATAGALVFAARRLEAEGVVMLFAARPPGFPAPGLEELELPGLPEAEAVALLRESVGAAIPDAVASDIAAATGGNPLALRELPGRLRPEQLAGAEPLPHPLPVGTSLETLYASTAQGLSEAARRALVVAATADTRAMRVIARTIDADAAALEECEASGLLTLADGTVAFTHPIVRSAIYHQATPHERRAAHRALAVGLAGDRKYAERRAWHAAAAVVEPDEDAAAGLEAAGLETSARRGHVAAAAMFERAARLSPAAEGSARRLYLAARSARFAGQIERASRLLVEAAESTEAPLLAADVVHLQARISLSEDGVSALVATAGETEALDPVRAAEMLAVAAESAGPEERVDLARRAVALSGKDDAAGLHATLVLVRALLDAGKEVEAHDLMASARATLAEKPGLRHDPELIVVAVETLARVGSGDDPLSRELLEEVTAAARAHAVVLLPRALVLSAWRHFESGNWLDASVDFHEAARLAAETGRSRERAAALSGSGVIAALRGRAEEARAAATELGEDGRAAHIHGLLALAADDVAGAISQFEVSAARARGVPSSRFELVAARLRCGQRDEAEAAAAGLDGLEALWVQALLGDATAYDAAVAGAVERPFLVARIRLDRGEDLRRAGLRREARDQLESALETFRRLDAEPWSERARRELRASGAKAREREPSTVDELTPQELQIARMIADGASQKAVAAALYLSPKTIEYHLRKVYRKLEIGSSRQLRLRLDERKLLEAS